MYTAMFVALAIAAFGIYRRWSIWRRGKDAPIFDNFGARLKLLLKQALAQSKILKNIYAALMHPLISFSILALFIGTTIIFLDQDILKPLGIEQTLRGSFYLGYEFVLDIFGLLLVVGAVLAIARRAFFGKKSLPTILDDPFILGGFLTIGATGFTLEVVRLAVFQPTWAWASVLGQTFAQLIFPSGLSAEGVSSSYTVLWWVHALLAFGMVAAFPFSKTFHILVSSANVFFQRLAPKGELTTPFNLQKMMESGEFDVKVGVKELGDYTWKQRLSFDACTLCGRCEEACPAYASGRILSPMNYVRKLKHLMLAKPLPNGGGKVQTSLHGDVIPADELWACTTCYACQHECPVCIQHIDLIVDMRRNLVSEGNINKSTRDFLANLSLSGNPWGFPPADRAAWAEDLNIPLMRDMQDVDVLYWVGCSGSYDPRNQAVSKQVAKILKAAGVKFAILGPEEKCNSESARRIGEEGRFQQSVMENLEVLKKYRFRKILTQCPHCFNTFKNEYPRFGGNFEIVHHTQYILDLIRQGRLKPNKTVQKPIVYHDSCYLTRYNSIQEEPRNLLQSVPGVKTVEMQRNRQRSFCCGAGGGNMWYEVEKQEERINVLRFKEATATGSKDIATACPFCLTMLEDAAKKENLEESVKIKDVAEIVSESL